MMAWSDQIDEKLLDRLMAYVDDELDPKDRRAVEGLIAEDDKLRLVVMEMRETKAELSAMYAGLDKQPAPKDLVDLVRSHPMTPAQNDSVDVRSDEPAGDVVPMPSRDERSENEAEDGPSDASGKDGKPSIFLSAWSSLGGAQQMLIAASLACLLIGGGLGFQAGLWTGETPTATVAEAPGWIEQVAQNHRDVASDRDHLVQVGADREAVEQWLTTRMEHPIRVPDLSAQNLTFAGANQLLVNGRRVAQLLYLDQDGEVFGFCLARLAPDGEAKPPTPSADGDLNMVSWREGDLGYIVVGWEPSDLLQQLAQQIKLIYSV
jgi:anti-sigma factor RsiW